LQVATFNKQLQ